MIRVIVVAPALALRAGLRALLQTAEELAVVGDLPGVAELSSLAAADVLVVTADALGALEPGLHAEPGALALLLISDDPAAARGLSSLPLRAWGLLPLDATPEELALAVRAVHAGLCIGSPVLLSPLLARRSSLLSSTSAPLPEPLTLRESEVLQLLAHGLANKQIAASLGISEHTVKFHVSAIYTKLGATNRTEAVRLGAERGLVVL